MEMDYRKLCIELFGTDDNFELKNIAQEVNNRNPRNAGRKKLLSENDIQDIQNLMDEGHTINEIAKRYNTSRQIISKYVHKTAKPKEGTTLRISYMYRNQLCTVIDVDFLKEKLVIENHTNDFLRRAFGVLENPTWKDFEYFLKERCFPKTRGNCKEILNEMQLDHYDPLRIVEKTQGRMAEDDMWMKFTYYDRKEEVDG